MSETSLHMESTSSYQRLRLALTVSVAFAALAMPGFAQPVLPATEQPVPAQSQAAPPDVARPTARFYGFVQTHFRYAFATGADGVVDASDFRVQRVRLGVRGDLRPWLSYEVEIDPRAPDVTGLLRDGFLALKVIPRHQIRVGQQKTQFGYENRESSSDLFVVNRAELSDALSRGKNLRDIGVGLIGNVRLGKGWRFEDAVTVVNGDGMNVQADSTRRKNVWGRAGLRYRRDRADVTVRVGVSAANGDTIAEGLDPADPADDYRAVFSRLGTDVEIDHPRFLLTSEYVRGTDENTVTGDADERSGSYVGVVGKTPWKVGPLVRLDRFADEFKRWTIGGFYGLPSTPFRLLVNYERRARKDGLRGDDKFYIWTQVRF